MANLDKAQVPAKYSVASETLFHTPKDAVKDRIDVEIGDAKQPDFKPQFKVMRWDNEVNFSLRAEEDPTATTEVVGETIKYKAKDYEVHMYDRPEVSEDGGFEFEWVLPKKPKTNVLRATIQTKELDFFYQPALTPEEIAEGASRPDNVVGSYAAYHKTKGGMNDAAGKEYKVGKAFHIYRPEAVDADGARAWCDLALDEVAGELTVTVPQVFLDGAKYPVMIDPTFGYTTLGGSSVGLSGNIAETMQYSAPDNGTITNMSYGVSNSSGSTKGLLFTHSDLNLVSNGVGSAVAPPTTKGWAESTFSVSPTITSGTSYLLGFICSTSMTEYYDFGGGSLNHYDGSNSYATPQDMGSAATYDFQVSIYATYTAEVSSGKPLDVPLYKGISITGG